jgi:hypothetical protein
MQQKRTARTSCSAAMRYIRLAGRLSHVDLQVGASELTVPLALRDIAGMLANPPDSCQIPAAHPPTAGADVHRCARGGREADSHGLAAPVWRKCKRGRKEER